MENMNEELEQPFFDVITNRIEKQDEKIMDLEKKISSVPDNSKAIAVLIKGIEDLKNSMTNNRISEKDIRQLNINLNSAIGYFSQAAVNKVEHHHHFPKIVIISAVLLAITFLLIAGWFNTYQRLDQYQENDTKYRFLKVQHNNRLLELLNNTDSLYNAQSNMREDVKRKEDSIMDRFRRIQELEAKEKEVKYIKEKLNK